MAGTIVSSDSDDLDITDSVRKELGANGHEVVDVESATESEPSSDHAPAKKQLHKRDRNTKGERINWSDNEDPEEAYKNFQDRKSAKRRKTAATTRKAKAKDTSGLAHTSERPKRNGQGKTPGKQMRDWGELEDDANDLMEYTLPDYLQARRAKFDKRMDTMKEAGLKLPPSYEDIVFSDDEDLEHLKEKPDFPGGKLSAPYRDKPLPKSLGLIPAPIAQWLRDYQVEGTAFLHAHFVYQSGGLLGDDMGLGKTVQVIAFLTAAFGKTGDERDAKRMRKIRRGGSDWYPRVLVVCPGTLIENWKAELKRWGWWHVYIYHGDTNTKEAALEAAIAGRIEIMITTYTTYRMNKGEINIVEWDCVIADECHMIKGRSSETTQAMNEINALCRIGLTGTAIQNSYDELWTLLNWTNPGKFGPISTWKTTISNPLRQGQSHDATIYELSKARKTAKALVQNLLPAFFLRRMKNIIADQLPKKSDRVVFCPLTDTQTDAYENCVDNEYIQYIKDSTQPCACGSGKKQGWCCHTHLPNGVKWQSYVFPAIANLQKVSNHLALLIPQSNEPKDKQDKDLETLQIAVPDQWRQLYSTRDSILNYSNPEFCGKWKILKKLLKFWHSNGDHKVLVFSHSVKLLKMLQLLFNNTSYPVSYLDGSMNLMDRAKAVDNFNSDPAAFVFLISTRAGGVGLNITSANKVVVVDPNWNPSYDLQAQDRAYRIGQARDVEVFRLVSAGTIEEVVYARQIYKQQQANIAYTASSERRYFKGVQENKEQKGEIFGLANLFAFQGDNLVLREVVNKTNVAESRAGVQVVGLELSQSSQSSTTTEKAIADGNDDEDSAILGNDEEEDSAMSQLASIIVHQAEAAAGKKPRSTKAAGSTTNKKKSDPIQAILAGAGVEYTHENSEVVGSSRVEASLSRRAQEAGNDIDYGAQPVFAPHPQDPQPPINDPSREAISDLDENPQGNKKAGEIRWRYRPPEEVRKRQFCTMALNAGFEDVVEFACVVEGWTQSQRRDHLYRFYKARRRELGLV